MNFLSEFNDLEKQARVALLKLDHIYYKHDNLYAKMKDTLSSNKNKLNEIYIVENSQ